MYIYIYREIVNGGYERNDRWLRDDLVLILIWVFFCTKIALLEAHQNKQMGIEGNP